MASDQMGYGKGKGKTGNRYNSIELANQMLGVSANIDRIHNRQAGPKRFLRKERINEGICQKQVNDGTIKKSVNYNLSIKI